MSERKRIRRPPSSTSPSGSAKLSAESRLINAPRSRFASRTRSSSSRMRSVSSSVPSICTRPTPSTDSSRRLTTFSASASERSSSGCSSAAHTTGRSLSLHDQMPTSRTVLGSFGRARSMRSRTSALAKFMSVSALKSTLMPTLSWFERLSTETMPGSVRSSSSSTRATCSSFSGALAPGFAR